MKESAENPNAKHPIAPWRVVVTTAAFVAVGTVASGVSVDAGAALRCYRRREMVGNRSV